MEINYGPYIIKTHELDHKLSVQVTSDLGNVSMSEEEYHPHGFPNAICFDVDSKEKRPEPKGLKRFMFGEYTFILGINNLGELSLFHSIRLSIGKKVIDGKDTLTLAFFKDPKN